ncbi:iron dicitrate transport regulator FecR [Stenotrophomonas maltophilia]|uniref:FecR family protein n=1 Tax=Stenotrophomonas maltophilia TaxID=40324 RepID=UPI000DA76753|nr:FecR domain-containing protein [Stenotrophomonas maltophilia]PZT28862.1 iron dicitrate transport regulator FecR [Stenotrophomonas maltophilia]
MSPPNTSSPAACEDVVAEQAMRWIAWLASGDITDAGMCEFEEWLAQPGHRHAFEQQRTLWRSIGPRPAVASAVRRRRRRQRLRWVTAAAAALAMLMIWPEASLRLQADHRSRQSVQHVQLPDGSRAVLDADSAIAVHFDAGTRRVDLLRGRAWFEVVADPQRRFSVSAGNGVVEDISTAFSVSRVEEAVETQVGQGRVRVAAPADSGWTYLQAGQRAQYGSASGVVRLSDVAADSVGAWRQGELLLEQANVADAVHLLGRYRAGPTFVQGDLSTLPAVSAALRIDRPEQALDALAETTGLRITRLPMAVVIVHR